MDYEGLAIGHCMTLSGIARAYNLGLRPKVFVDPVRFQAFTAMLEYWTDNYREKTYTLEMLQDEFPGEDWEEFLNPEESIDWVVEKLKKRYVRNEMQNVIRAAVKCSVDDDPEVAIRQLQEDSTDIIRETSQRLARLDMSQNVEDRQKRYDERATFSGEIKGIPTGFDEVDAHTFGLLKGELAIVVAYSGIGKSTHLVNTLVSARRQGYTGVLFTMELGVDEMADKIDATLSGLPHTKIQRGSLTPDERMHLINSQREFAELGPMFVEKPPVGERTVQALVNRARELRADFILIDQLSFMESRRNYRNQHEAASEILFELKAAISEDENSMIPVFLAAQFNRESMKEKKGRGQMHQIALSAAVEQCADIAYGLHATNEHRVNNSMVMDELKFRRGPIKSWLLEWSLSDETKFSVRGEIEA